MWYVWYVWYACYGTVPYDTVRYRYRFGGTVRYGITTVQVPEHRLRIIYSRTTPTWRSVTRNKISDRRTDDAQDERLCGTRRRNFPAKHRNSIIMSSLRGMSYYAPQRVELRSWVSPLQTRPVALALCSGPSRPSSRCFCPGRALGSPSRSLSTHGRRKTLVCASGKDDEPETGAEHQRGSATLRQRRAFVLHPCAVVVAHDMAHNLPPLPV